MNPVYDVFIEKGVSELLLLFSHHQMFKKKQCFVFCKKRTFETFGMKELHDVSLEGKDEGGRGVKKVQERRLKGVVPFQKSNFQTEPSYMRRNN